MLQFFSGSASFLEAGSGSASKWKSGRGSLWSIRGSKSGKRVAGDPDPTFPDPTFPDPDPRQWKEGSRSESGSKWWGSSTLVKMLPGDVHTVLRKRSCLHLIHLTVHCTVVYFWRYLCTFKKFPDGQTCVFHPWGTIATFQQPCLGTKVIYTSLHTAVKYVR